MSLRVAVQMDPLESIGIEGDSTFAIMLGAQARGHKLYHYAPEALNWRDGRLWAQAHPVIVQRVAGDHFRFGDPEILDLGRDADVVLMRQDPPFDLGYITATHLLERIQGQTLVVNDPASVRNAPEKVWVLDYARFMPPTVITRSLSVARQFLAHQDPHSIALGQPLDPRGEVHRIADQRIGQPLRRAHIADAAQASVEADADLHIGRPGIGLLHRHVPVRLCQTRDHGERRARRVAMLVGIVERRVPEGENGVADELVDGGLMREQYVAHRRQEADQETDHLLGIERL